MCIVVYMRVIDCCIGIKMGYAICVKDATVLAIGMRIFGNKDYACMVFNQPSFGNSCGPLTVQRIRTSISWQEYTVQLYQFHI